MGDTRRRGHPDAPEPRDPPAGPLTGRQSAIISMVAEQGFATIDALTRRFGVSAQSIRRDIIRLDAQGLVQRFHGGAGVRGNVVRLGYADKRERAAAAKARIGEAAAALVPAGASVFLDVGTTVEAAARALAGRQGLRLFAVSLQAALLLAGRGHGVVLPPGEVRTPDGALTGGGTVAAIARHRFDVAVIGLSGFDEDGAPMDFDHEKVAVKQAAIARAGMVIAVADASKFGRGALVRIEPAARFHHLVGDAPPPPRLRRQLAAAGVRFTLA